MQHINPPYCNTDKNRHTKKTEQKKVDWDVLLYATSKDTGNHSIWATHLASKELPTGKVMQNRGSW